MQRCKPASPPLPPPLAFLLLQAPGIDPGRLTVSLAESLCFRAFAKPATFVFKLWASYKVVMLLKFGQGGGNGAPQPVQLGGKRQ